MHFDKEESEHWTYKDERIIILMTFLDKQIK